MLKNDAVIEMVDRGDLSDEYCDFIMNNCGGDRLICNGDMLIEAMEDCYLLNEFVEFFLASRS